MFTPIVSLEVNAVVSKMLPQVAGVRNEVGTLRKDVRTLHKEVDVLCAKLTYCAPEGGDAQQGIGVAARFATCACVQPMRLDPLCFLPVLEHVEMEDTIAAQVAVEEATISAVNGAVYQVQGQITAEMMFSSDDDV